MEEEEEAASTHSRKELRKQKLMEYLAAKGRLKPHDPKPYLRDDCLLKKPLVSGLKVSKGKENKASADTLRNERTKVKTVAALSSNALAGKAFAVADKVNVRGGAGIGQQRAKFVTGGPGKPGCDRSHMLIKTDTVVSSKFSGHAARHVTQQPSTGIKSSARDASNAASHRFGRNSSAARSDPVTTFGARISLGPLVKTKTGLIPAAIQPRSAKSHVAPSSTAAASVASKAQRSNLSSVKPVNDRATVSSSAGAGIKVHNQKNPDTKPQPRPTSMTQSSQGLKSASTSKLPGAAVKPDSSRKIVNTRLTSATDSTNRSTEQAPGGEQLRNGKPCKTPFKTTSVSVSRSSSRAVRVSSCATVVEPGMKNNNDNKAGKEPQNKKEQLPVPPAAPRQSIKRTEIAAISKTAPQPARTISYTRQAQDGKSKLPIKVVPQTEGKKVSTAQAERMRKLQEWREAKGISYKRPAMPVKPQVRRTVAVPQPFWASMKEEEDAHSLISAVDRSLADCIKLLEEGSSPDQVRGVLARLPAVSQKFAKYWICQARLMEQEGNLDVLPMFEEAVRVALGPVDELRAVVFEILKKKDELQASEENEQKGEQNSTAGSPDAVNNPMTTPKPVRALISGEKGDSSVIKYKITATPGGPPTQRRESSRVNGLEVRFFTPVRRSVRIEKSSLRYPPSLQDHDLCVASYNDLISKEEEEDGGDETSPASSQDAPIYIYRENEALEDKVFVRLVCEDV